MFSTLQVWCIIKISVLHFKVSTCTLLSPLFVGKPIPLPERNVGCLIPKDFLVFRIWCILSFWGMFMREKGSGEQRIWYATDYEDNLKNLSIPHVVWNIFLSYFHLLWKHSNLISARNFFMSVIWQANVLPNFLFLSEMTAKMARNQP